MFAVYPFTPQQSISDATITAAYIPVFCGVGGGLTNGVRSASMAAYVEHQGAYGVVCNSKIGLDTIRAMGVGIAEVTLHVGLGTFRPVQEDEISDHKMHSEWYSISEETARRIRETKAAGHRVIAVGTTSCRTLEAAAAKYGEIKACSGNTSIFLYPGVKFNCIDGLITNFHLPESTLIMLVSALYGYEKTMHAYEVAVAEKYRFFSFGDAMLIL